MELGRYLRAKRESANRTQPDVANEVQIEQSYLSKIESGKSIPSQEVFNKLQQAYGFKVEELVQSISSSELTRLSEIKSITSSVSAQTSKKLNVARKWLISGLIALSVGAGALAFSILPDRSAEQFTYRSEGVLTLDEDLNTFELVYEKPEAIEADLSLVTKRKALLTRLAQKELTSLEFKGNGFIVNSEEGRRYFKLLNTIKPVRESWTRWFFVPAIMLLVAGVSCFFIAKRWDLYQ